MTKIGPAPSLPSASATSGSPTPIGVQKLFEPFPERDVAGCAIGAKGIYDPLGSRDRHFVLRLLPVWSWLALEDGFAADKAKGAVPVHRLIMDGLVGRRA